MVLFNLTIRSRQQASHYSAIFSATQNFLHLVQNTASHQVLEARSGVEPD
jgi:hypothetical protein